MGEVGDMKSRELGRLGTSGEERDLAGEGGDQGGKSRSIGPPANCVSQHGSHKVCLYDQVG